MKIVSQFIVHHWKVVVALASLLALLAGLGLALPRKMGAMEDSSSYDLKAELDGEFGSDGSECLILVDVVGGGDLFSGNRLDAVVELERRVESEVLVDQVLSLTDITTVNWMGIPRALVPREGFEESLGAGERQEVLEHPFGRQLISKDGKSMILPVLFTRAAMNKSFIENVEAVQRAVDGMRVGDGLRVRLTGLYPIWVAERDAVNRDQVKFIVVGYILTSLLAIYLFRSLWVAAAIGLPTFIGVFWTVGILAFLNVTPTPLTQVVMPMMLTMVGFTDAVHLMFHIRRRRCAGESRTEAAISAVRDLGVPCALTSLTTAVGFGSLLVAEAEVIRSFGLSCAVGVVLTFLAVLTLVPLLSMTRLGKNVHRSQEHDFMEKHRTRAEGVVGFLLKRARWIVAASAALMVVFAIAASTLRPDNRFDSRMPDRSEAFQALIHVDQHLGGTQVLRVSLKWEEDSLDEAALLEKLEGVERILEEEELLGPPLSLRTVLKSTPAWVRTFLRLLPQALFRSGNDTEAEEMVDTGEVLVPGSEDLDLVGRMEGLGIIPENVVGGVYQSKARKAIVASRVQDLGIATYKEVFDRVDARLVELEEPGVKVEMTGAPIIWGRYLDRMVTDLVKSLALASVIILIVMGIVYRSVRIGLIAIVPNLFPLAATGAMLAFFGIPLVIETVCAFTICLGIAVDDTIHFMSRYRFEMQKGTGSDEAIRASFIKVGSPLVVTTVLMVTGFATVQWSELPNFRMFGAMACATLAAAFIADLVILPALLKVFGEKSRASVSARD